MKRYIPLYEAKDDDKYYDVTIENPDTKREIQLMTALSYPEESEVYKKAIEIKKYLDSNGGKGVEVDTGKEIDDEDIADDNDDEISDATKGVKNKSKYEQSIILTDLSDSLEKSNLDNFKKEKIKDKIYKAEKLRQKYYDNSDKLDSAKESVSEKINVLSKDISKLKADIKSLSKKEELSDKDKEKLSKLKDTLKTKKDKEQELKDSLENIEELSDKIFINIKQIDAKIEDFSKSISNVLNANK